MAGELAPDSGTVEVGATVKIGHFSQEGRELGLNQPGFDFIHAHPPEVRPRADGLRQLVQEEPVMGYRQNGAGETQEIILQNGEGSHVQVVGGLVQQQHVGGFHQHGQQIQWQAERRAEEALSPKAEKPKPAAERPRERKLKFTFKEQREFETIDAGPGGAGGSDHRLPDGAGELRQRLCEAPGAPGPSGGAGGRSGRKDGAVGISE